MWRRLLTKGAEVHEMLRKSGTLFTLQWQTRAVLELEESHAEDCIGNKRADSLCLKLLLGRSHNAEWNGDRVTRYCYWL